MKKISLFAAFFALLLAAGCANKSCKDVVCGVGQICNNGNCYCNDGYYGANCDSQSYVLYTDHTYLVTEFCTSGLSVSSSYYTNISYYSVGTVTINNFLNQGFSITANLVGDASHTPYNLYIPQQSIGSGTVQGQGYYNVASHVITFQLNYTFNFQTNSCTQNFQMQ